MSKNNLSKKVKKLQYKAAKKDKHNKKNNLFIILLTSIVIVLIAIFIVVILPNDSKPEPGGTLSPAAKAFTLPDTDDKIHNLNDYAGKPILLDFTASWCKWCHVQAPELIRLHKDYGDEFTMLSINTGEDKKTAKYNKEMDGCPWPFLVDQDGAVMREYGATGLPYLVLLKPDGTKYIDQSGYKKDFYDSFSSAIRELR